MQVLHGVPVILSWQSLPYGYCSQERSIALGYVEQRLDRSSTDSNHAGHRIHATRGNYRVDDVMNSISDSNALQQRGDMQGSSSGE